ncbi:MAG: hypothetical protein DMF63_17355 [Acidobacteria bacterium]|nr:MAG: hypothetical protein DMF63_17355 [Acidobacteriota bacterium]
MRESLSKKRFAVDTTFVLFFLGIDFGQSSMAFRLDSVFSALTLGMLLFVPYFLPSIEEKPDFTGWLMGRSLIAVFAVALGLMFRQSLGIVLPETFRFLPLTLVIVTAMLSCSLQFYGMIRFRLAR